MVGIKSGLLAEIETGVSSIVAINELRSIAGTPNSGHDGSADDSAPEVPVQRVEGDGSLDRLNTGGGDQIDAGLLLELSQRAILQCLPGIQKAAWESPYSILRGRIRATS